MLKLGFKEDIEKIMYNIKEKAPHNLQILLFSATIPSWVNNIASIIMSSHMITIDLAKSLRNKTS